MRRGLGTSEGEEQEQEMENLSENIMKENFPNLAKETDLQEVHNPKKVVPKEEHTKTHLNFITQD